MNLDLVSLLTCLKLPKYTYFPCNRIKTALYDDNLEKLYHNRLYRNTGLHTPLKPSPMAYLSTRYPKTYRNRYLALAYSHRLYRATTRSFIDHKAKFFLNNYYFLPINTGLSVLINFIPTVTSTPPYPTLN
jgi:hypothetical protein